MVKSNRFVPFGLSRRAFVIVFLLFNTLVWFYMIFSIISSLFDSLKLSYFESIAILAVFCSAVVGFSLAGAVLAEKFQRLHILYVWITFGVIASLIPALFEKVAVGHIIVFSLLWGASFGLGMPSCLASFANAFSVKNRGRASGIIFLVTNFCALPMSVMVSSPDFVTNSLICVVWRVIGLAIILGSKFKEAEITPQPRRELSFSHVLRDRAFILYLIPWILFCLINRLGDPIIRPVYETILKDFPSIIQPIVGGIFAFVGGLLADRIGRKKVVIYGFVSLGLAFAIVGIFPQSFHAWIIFVLINAISAGILWVMFILTLWGDLTPKDSIEKYYAIGNMPFFVTWGILQLVSVQYLTSIPTNAIFSFASFFLFLAILPLLYAPETLPEKEIEQRRLKKYLEDVKKVKKKHEKE